MAIKVGPFGKKKKVSDPQGAKGSGNEIDVFSAIPKRQNSDDIELNRNIVRIGKSQFAIGLRWKGMTGETPRHQLEQMTSGDSTKRDLYVNNKESIGFGSTTMGHAKGIPPLALCLDKSILGENFAAAFRLGKDERSKWWVVKSQDGIIFPDQLVADEDSAHKLLENQTYSANPEQTPIRIIAPVIWNVSDSVTAELTDVIITDPKRVPKLRYFSWFRNNLIMILGVSAIALSAGGGYYAMQVMAERKAEAARVERERQKNRIKVENDDYPWFSTVKVADFVSACEDGFSRIMAHVPGWDIQPLNCVMDRNAKPKAGEPRAVTVSASWQRRDGGRTDWLRAAFEGSPISVSIAGTGRSASVSLPMSPAFDPDYFQSKPWEASDINRIVVDRFINYGIQAVFGEDVKSVRGKVESPIFNGHNFSVVSGYDPKEWVGLLNDVPAAVPISLSWNPGNGEWAFSGRIYHPAILPLGAY